MNDNQIKLYAYFDTASKSYDRLFPAKNDLVAQRIAKQTCETLYKQDKLLCNDLELHYIGVLDLESGKITENVPKEVFIFKDYVSLTLTPQLSGKEEVKNA